MIWEITFMLLSPIEDALAHGMRPYEKESTVFNINTTSSEMVQKFLLARSDDIIGYDALF